MEEKGTLKYNVIDSVSSVLSSDLFSFGLARWS